MVGPRYIIDHEFIVDEVKLLQPVGIGKRILNVLIDYIGILIFGFVLGIFLSLIGCEEWIRGDHVQNKNLYNIYLAAFIFFFYYLLMEFLFRGKTLGKFFTKTKVVCCNGYAPSFLTVLNRTIYRFIPFEPLSIFFYKRGAWHDVLTKTKVVEDVGN